MSDETATWEQTGIVTLDDLWVEMWHDLQHNATGTPSGLAIIANWRVVIEAAIRAEGLAPRAVDALDQALEGQG